MHNKNTIPGSYTNRAMIPTPGELGRRAIEILKGAMISSLKEEQKETLNKKQIAEDYYNHVFDTRIA